MRLPGDRRKPESDLCWISPIEAVFPSASSRPVRALSVSHRNSRSRRPVSRREEASRLRSSFVLRRSEKRQMLRPTIYALATSPCPGAALKKGYQRPQSWRRLVAARMVEIEARERLAPVFQHPHQLARRYMRFNCRFLQAGQAYPCDRCITDEPGVVHGNRPRDFDLEWAGLSVERPAADVIGDRPFVVDARVGRQLVGGVRRRMLGEICGRANDRNAIGIRQARRPCLVQDAHRSGCPHRTLLKQYPPARRRSPGRAASEDTLR